jgi:hypothetical protein
VKYIAVLAAASVVLATQPVAMAASAPATTAKPSVVSCSADPAIARTASCTAAAAPAAVVAQPQKAIQCGSDPAVKCNTPAAVVPQIVTPIPPVACTLVYVTVNGRLTSQTKCK